MAFAVKLAERRVAPGGKELCLAMDKSGEKRLILIIPVKRDRVRLEILRKLRGLLATKQLIETEGFFTIDGVEHDEESLLLAFRFDQDLWDGWTEGLNRRLTPEEAVALLSHATQVVTACRRQEVPWFGFHPTDIVWLPSLGPGLIDPRLGMILNDVVPVEPQRALCLPPEVVKGGDWTESAALYTIGLTVYTMLGGAFPFQAGDFSEAAESVLRETPLDIRYAAPETGAELSRLLTALLQKDPAKRPSPAGAQEMLEGVLRQGVVASLDERQAFAEKAERVEKKQKGARAVRNYWRRRKMAWAVSLLVVLLAYFYSRPLSAPVLTEKTTPGQAVALYYQAFSQSDAVTMNELLAPGTDRKMIEMATLAQVLSDFNPLGPRDVMHLNDLTIQKVSETETEAVYSAAYQREIISPQEVQKEWCEDRIVLQPIRKLWRIVQYESKILKKEVIKTEVEEDHGVDNP